MESIAPGSLWRKLRTLFRLFSVNQQMLGAILALNLLIGCATPQITPIPRGEPLSIVFTKNPKTNAPIGIRNADLGSDTGLGAGTGATGGAVAGALVGLTCGPFFVFCSPVLAKQALSPGQSQAPD